TDGHAQGTPERGRLLGCPEVAAPVTFSGLSTLSLLSFDLGSGDGIGCWNGAGVVASGATMYATAEHTYVTTTPWMNWAGLAAPQVRIAVQHQRTQVHLFDTPGSGAPRYVASGSVPGVLLGQFAMDEYQGRLRVASTDQPTFVLPEGAPMESLPLPAPADGTASSGSVASGSVSSRSVSSDPAIAHAAPA